MGINGSSNDNYDAYDDADDIDNGDDDNYDADGDDDNDDDEEEDDDDANNHNNSIIIIIIVYISLEPCTLYSSNRIIEVTMLLNYSPNLWQGLYTYTPTHAHTHTHTHTWNTCRPGVAVSLAGVNVIGRENFTLIFGPQAVYVTRDSHQ